MGKWNVDILGKRRTQSLYQFVCLVLTGAALVCGAIAPSQSADANNLADNLAGPSTVRFAVFNAYLNRDLLGQLIQDLSTPDQAQAQAVAEIIQRTNPDVLLLQEFDYDASGESIRLFQQHYLSIGQNGALPVEYPYVYLAETNTGLPSGFDLDNSGSVDSTLGDRTYGGDAYGFGLFPGQYGMVLLSKYPILAEQVRTFQTFRWADMPAALLPDDLDTPEPNDWFSAAELEQVRLSSKNHWDVPIQIGETNPQVIHVLAAHPTPPVFDGPEDRNGRRNADEIRLWADYISPGQSAYLYDDEGQYGGLPADEHFIIMGDLNADPNKGEAYPGAIAQLLDHPRVNTCIMPTSDGAWFEGSRDSFRDRPEADTAKFPGIGNYRLDYVLPSTSLLMVRAFVFWPTPTDPLYRLVGSGDPIVSSDHRAVVVDVRPAESADDKVEGGVEGDRC